ncbi:MAG: hypothetical protein QCI00_00555 [Candidatus Thermoplasmatota archaeon]|nr:hypothetical protein [Candidatus Thermoplasmatota archaeon]
MKAHNHQASIALPLTLILLVVLFIALTATSMMTNQVTTSQQDLTQYVDDALYEITSYIQIKNVYATYSKQAPYHLDKIAIFTSPLFHQKLDLSTYILHIQTDDTLHLYKYNYTISPMGLTGVFSHPIWDQQSEHHFGIISIQDPDDSLISHHSFSEPADMAVFTILVENLSIENGDVVRILLSPGQGVEKTIMFRVPLPTRTVVNLW